MCEGEDRARALQSRLETCCVAPERIARLAAFERLLESRRGNSSSWKHAAHRPSLRKWSRLERLFYYAHWASSPVLTPLLRCCCRCTWARLTCALLAVACACLALVLRGELHTPRGFARFWLHWENVDLNSEQCTVDMPALVQDTFRPPVDCAMCSDVTQVDRVAAIKPKDFEARYAYSGRPVVVVDGQRDWSAPEAFSFAFFRSIYAPDSPVLRNVDRGCQFFPYRTAFANLREVFNMSRDRATMADGTPWYIGWSNCDSEAATIIRDHYSRPYFLPEVAEESNTDWIFMGTPGHGAHLHIDHVGDPSWQAQIRGRKRWSLEPPPECFFQCASLEVTVGPGEIIVLDTNIWYHGTYILPAELSITIGSEYD